LHDSSTAITIKDRHNDECGFIENRIRLTERYNDIKN
jgi:hypothetical protein